MNVRIVSYTAKGAKTARRVSDALNAQGLSCRRFAKAAFRLDGDEELTVSASEWAKDGFQNADALIFVCACGIAVRAIAPWVQSKTTDPAVLVLDEAGAFVIPLLSGHIGGANALASALSDALGATAVVTTATDLNGLFAVDVFAEQNGLSLSDMALAKDVSAALLRGEPVGFCSDVPVEGDVPEELNAPGAAIGVCVTFDETKTPYARTLRLIPKRYVAGVGCKRGKSEAELRAFVRACLNEQGLTENALCAIASIDRKRDEAGLIALCDALNVPFWTYSADELNALDGAFSKSAFVLETIGTDSVCERAAVCAGGTLVGRKIAQNGMTFALAKKEEAIRFV